MASDPMEKAIQDLNRTLKEIASSLKEQNRILKTMRSKQPNEVVVPVIEEDEPVVIPPVEDKPEIKTYGFSMAALVQREGNLNIGDQKIELDESRWFWTGETWERVELPSGET